MLEWTGERFLTWGSDPFVAYEHMHRYAFASQFVKERRVLDLASGEGYGSALLSRAARLVVGLDIDDKAVRHARAKYRIGNLQFVPGSITAVPLLDASFDVIVCFEAIEHIGDQEGLLGEMKRLLAPGGLVVISTPNKPAYREVEPSNPFHVKELDFEEFRALMSRHFSRTLFLGQRVYCNSSLWPVGGGPSGKISEILIERDAGEFVFSSRESRIPLYYLAMASDAEALPPVEGAILVDGSNALLEDLERIRKELEQKTRSQEEALAWREEQERQARKTIRSQEEALSWRETQLGDFRKQVDYLEQTVRAQQAEREELVGMIDERNRKIEELEGLAAELHDIKSSRSWKLMQKIQRLRDTALPADSRRRSIYDRLLRSFLR